VWFKENLKVSKYRNGNAIPTGLTDSQWGSATGGACAIYNNDPANNTTYGKLYNWYAVADSRGLCPVGWHIPTDHDWNLLTKQMDSSADTSSITQTYGNIAGGKLKSTGTILAGTGLWNDPNTDATNISGFTGVPSGSRAYNGTFGSFRSHEFWWSSTGFSSDYAWFFYLTSSFADFYRSKAYTKFWGFSVRCLKD
jgi:uncharacterized protein (TIGR02145 family)